MLFKCFRSDGSKGKRSKKHVSCCIVLLGVDNAGKTTLLSALKGEPQSHITPTWGFSTDTVPIRGAPCTVFDLGGGKRIRDIWQRYFAEVHGAIFVVDSADSSRLEEARSVFAQAVKDPRMAGKPLLVLANKQDEPGALTAAKLSEHLDISAIAPEPPLVRVLPCVARIPEGSSKMDSRIDEGTRWLTRAIKDLWPTLKAKVEKESAEEKEAEERRRAERKARAEANRKEREANEAAEAAAGPIPPPSQEEGRRDPKSTPAVAKTPEPSRQPKGGDGGADEEEGGKGKLEEAAAARTSAGAKPGTHPSPARNGSAARQDSIAGGVPALSARAIDRPSAPSHESQPPAGPAVDESTLQLEEDTAAARTTSEARAAASPPRPDAWGSPKLGPGSSAKRLSFGAQETAVSNGGHEPSAPARPADPGAEGDKENHRPPYDPLEDRRASGSLAVAATAAGAKLSGGASVPDALNDTALLNDISVLEGGADLSAAAGALAGGRHGSGGRASGMHVGLGAQAVHNGGSGAATVLPGTIGD